jgi:hypothetical protein
MLNSVKYLFSHLLYSKKKKKPPLQYTYDYILEIIVRRFKKEDIEKMRLYFILAFIYKTFMVWPGANNQLDYTKVLFGWIEHSYCFNV